MKSITTLTEDIYDLFRKPHKADPGRVDDLGRAIAQKVGERFAEERASSYLRMSNLGKGDRKLWYEIKHPELSGESLEPYTKIKFLFGDILELLLIFFAEEAGHEVGHKQAQVEVDGVKGSIDCVIDGVLVDSKSASTRAFEKFKRHRLPEDDPFGYMEQLAGYSEGMGNPDAGFLAIDKQLGHVVFDPHTSDELRQYRVRDRIAHLKEVLASDEIPERCHPDEPYGKSGNMVLGTNCSYCPFKKQCWKDSNNGIGLRTFMYAKGPVHFTEVNKEPDVMEVTF